MTNYFDFYQLPIGFHPDQAEVKKQFYALSKKFHPDFYINKTEEEQQKALELATENNKAYQVLSNERKLVPYVLELKGVLAEGENYKLPQEFLMEMMDVNEAVMDLQFDPDPAKLEMVQKDIASVEDGFSQKLRSLTAEFDAAGDETVLQEIKDINYREKYLVRIKESLNKLK